MTTHLIWALVATIWALVLWDMVRRWSFATATRTLKADLEAHRADLDVLRAELDLAKLPERVKKLETVTNVLKTHAETRQLATANPFRRPRAG